MRNKLSYLIGVAFLLCCSTSSLTSCLEIDETIDTAASGGGEEDSRLPKISGSYYEDEDGDNELYMTYNGRKLFSRKVMITPDEKNETAIFTFSGTELNLSGLFNDLLDFKFTTYSPIPGVRKLTVTDVKLTPMGDGKTYSFEGKYDQVAEKPDDYRMTFTGTVKEGELKIDIKCKILNEVLLGTWQRENAYNTEEAVAGFLTGNMLQSPGLAPLWVDWNTPQEIKLGKVGDFITLTGIAAIANGYPVEGPPNKLIGLISTKEIADAMEMHFEKLITNMFLDATADRTGNMYFSYSATGDMKNPPAIWSGGKEDDFSNNIVRYHFDNKIANKVYLEINPSFLLNALGGLTGTLAVKATTNTRALNNTPSTRADQYNTIALGKKLVEKLKPSLEQGFPCFYSINDANGKRWLQISIDGEYMRDVLRIIAELANDPFAYEEVEKFLNNDATLKGYAPKLLSLIQQLPSALDSRCQYVKLGLKTYKSADLAPEEPENPDPVEPENPDPENPENPEVRR